MALALPNNNNQDFCRGGHIYTTAEHCRLAMLSIEHATANQESSGPGPAICPSGLGATLPPGLYNLMAQMPQQAPMVGAFAGIAALAAFAIAFVRPRRRNIS